MSLNQLLSDQETLHKGNLLVIVGPTASGKSALAMKLAAQFAGEIVCCDAVTVYRGLDIGAAKPSPADRARVRHHCLDLLDPDESSTAGDFARTAREAFDDIRSRAKLPILAGGAGLYARATLEGLAPAPARDESLRERLRSLAQRRGTPALHRLLRRLDDKAALAIHPNDGPKLIRSLEVTLLGRRPQSEQWQAGRDALQGYRILRIGLDPPRPALYTRIEERAAAMFFHGLIEETQVLLSRYGTSLRVLESLGYAQATAVLNGELSLSVAIATAQQGHRNYAKRQLTWFRRDRALQWLNGFGDDPDVQTEAQRLVSEHLNPCGFPLKVTA